MSTGGSENEHDIVSGQQMTFVADLQLTLAQALRQLANLREQVARSPITVDVQVMGSGGQGVAQAAEQAAQKLRFAFQSFGKADELQSTLRGVQSHLEAIAEQAERTGRVLTLTMKGPGMEGSYTLRGKQDVGTFISQIPQQAASLGSPGERFKIGATSDVEWNESNALHLKAINESAGALTRHTNEQVKNEKATTYWREAIVSWGKGSRPQRGLSEMSTGFLQNGLGMGEMSSSLLGGALGMIGGGALFHIGWAITDALSKIPQIIGEHVSENQRLDVARSALLHPSLPGAPSPLDTLTGDPTQASQDSQFLLHLGIGRAAFRRLKSEGLDTSPDTNAGLEFEQILATLVSESAKTIPANASRGTAGQRENKDYEFARMAMLGQIFAGTGPAADMANAMRLLQEEQSPSAAMKLLEAPGMMKRMVDARRKAKNLQGFFTNEEIFTTIKGGITGAAGLGSPDEATRKKTATEVYDAFADMLHSNPVLAKAQTAFQQNHPLDYMAELLQSVMGTKETLAPKDLRAITAYMKDRDEGKSPAHALAVGARITDYERMKALGPYADALRGNVNGFFGNTGKQWADDLPMGQPKSQFSSLSGFANKMQSEAGIQLDYAETTATATSAMNTKMNTLITAVQENGAWP